MPTVIRAGDSAHHNPLGWDFWVPLPNDFIDGFGSVVVPFPFGGDAPYHAHPNAHVLIVSVSGTANGIIDGCDVKVEAGDVIHVAPGCPHKWITTSAEPWVSFAIHKPPVYDTHEVLDFERVNVPDDIATATTKEP